MSLLKTKNTYVYKNIRLYFYSWWGYLCGAEKQLQRVRTHEGVVRRQKSQWTTDFSQNSRTYWVYNSHVTCSNSSFSLIMVTPTSHFFAFHWLCCLLPIGYLPKPGSKSVHICHHHQIQPHPQVKAIFRYLQPDALFQHPPYSQHLWAWWHFGDHTGLINLSVNNIRHIHTRRSC